MAGVVERNRTWLGAANCAGTETAGREEVIRRPRKAFDRTVEALRFIVSAVVWLFADQFELICRALSSSCRKKWHAQACLHQMACSGCQVLQSRDKAKPTLSWCHVADARKAGF